MNFFWYLYFILQLLGIVKSSNFVRAFDPAMPMRIGKIYVAHEGNILMTNNVNIILDSALNIFPQGVLIGIRSMTTLDALGNWIQYSFLANSLSETSFTVSVKLSLTFNLNYSDIYLDYLICSPMEELDIHTIVSDQDFQKLTSSQITSYLWQFMSYWTVQEEQTFYHGSIVELKAVFPNFNFSFFYILQSTSYNKTQIQLQIPSINTVHTVKISLLISNKADRFQLNKTIDSKFYIQGLKLVRQEQYYYEDIYQMVLPQSFIGFQMLSPTGLPWKMDYSFKYSNQFRSNSSSQYIQNNLPTSLTFKQYGNPLSIYIFTLLMIGTIDCSNNPDHPYLLKYSQTCYDVCPSKTYLLSHQKQCKLCSKCTLESDCEDCFVTNCQNTSYFDINYLPSKCAPCSLLLNCLYCQANINGQFCIQCTEGFAMQSGVCDLNLISYKYFQEVNNYKIKYYFNFSIFAQNVLDFFSIVVRINNEEVDFVLNTDGYNMEIQIPISDPLLDVKLSIFFNNKTSSNIIERQQILATFQAINQKESVQPEQSIEEIQQQIYDYINRTFGAIADNSGIGIASLSIASSTMYFISFIWTVQIASIYLFVPVKKPKNLQLFLSTSTQLSSISLVPFSIPNPLTNVDYNPLSHEMYDKNNVDLFFVRNEFVTWTQVLVYLIAFSILCFLASFLPKHNCLTKFIRNKFVKCYFSNVINILCTVIVDVGFSASASLTKNSIVCWSDLLNRFSAAFGLLCCIVVACMVPIFLYFKKYQKEVDTEEAYLGGSRFKAHSEVWLGLYYLINVVVFVCIPHFSPLFALSAILLILVLNIWHILKNKCLDIYVCNIYRIIHLISFIIFNLVFVCLYILQKCFPHKNILVLRILGFIGIGSVCFNILLEVLQTLTEIIHDTYQFVKMKFLRKKSTGVKSKNTSKQVNFDLHQQQSNQTIFKRPNSNITLKRKMGIIANRIELPSLKKSTQKRNAKIYHHKIDLFDSSLSH